MAGFDYMLTGFSVALTPVNLMACFVGVLVGTLVGVLPGLGTTSTMALMLPFTLQFGPTAGLIMMAGVWYGAHYGGSTTSILVNIPGEASSVVTCIDGYQMARRGRAGAALAVSAAGSWIAGTFGVILLQLFAPPLAMSALAFGSSEYLALAILAFVVLANLTGNSPLKGTVMILLGLWLGLIGIDPVDGTPRFAYLEPLVGGVEFVPVAMGLFGIAELLSVAAEKIRSRSAQRVRLRDLYPNREEARRSVGPIVRGSALGFALGLLPGPSSVIGSFLSYSLEKKLSRTPEKFGTGMIEGVAGPEATNNSAVSGSLIPLLVLGIPFTAPAAVLLAGLMIHNVSPGPFLFQKAPEIFWGFVASMYLGNIMLLVLNLPLVGFWARIATVKPQVLMPIVAVICLVGAYSARNSLFDIWIMIVFGVLGFFLRIWGYPIPPLVIGLVLGPLTEKNFRQTVMLFHANYAQLLQRPIVVALLVTTVAFLMVSGFRRKLAPAIETAKE